MKETNVNEDISQKSKRLEEAEKSYREKWERIKPFIKKREIKYHSTAAEWEFSNVGYPLKE